MVKNSLLYLFIAGVLLWTACDAVPGPQEPLELTFVEYESPNYRVSFRYPQGWIVNDNADSIAILSSDGQPPETRVKLTIAPAVGLGRSNLLPLVELGSQSLLAQEGAELVVEPQMVVINNQQGAHAQARGESGGNRIFLEYALLLSNSVDQVATITAVTQSDAETAYLPVVGQILDSITLLPPE